MDTMSSRLSAVLGFYAQARPVLWLGILGLALAFACSAFALLYGFRIPPEGDLTKPISFDGAVGIYLLTIAVYVPFADFSERGRRRWMAWLIGLIPYAFGVETIQQLRGLDPRFSRYAGPIDNIAGLLFFLAALALIVNFVILAAKLMTAKRGGLILLGLRYACASTLIAFGAGLWMSAIQGRLQSPAGNILPLHALGFHGLQAIPLVAWFLSRSTESEARARQWVHLAGLTWIAGCLMVAWQTAVGQPLTQLSPAVLLAVLLFAVWTAAMLFAAFSWLRRVESSVSP